MARRNLAWPYIVLWLLVVAVFGIGYVVGQLSVSTLVFAEACTFTLGLVALVIWNKMRHPPETTDQVLYRTEHPTRS